MAFSQRQAGAKVAAASKTCYLESKSGDGPNIAVAPRWKKMQKMERGEIIIVIIITIITVITIIPIINISSSPK